MSPNQPQDDVIKRHVRVLSSGEVLFKQGDMGNTLFVIMSGAIRLIEVRAEKEFNVGLLAAGELLGEKAILSETPYTRTYTAKAEGETVLLEFNSKNIRIVETVIPNFTVRVLQIAAERLDRANKIISILRPFDPIERVVSALAFYAHEGTKTSEGVVVTATAESIHALSNVDLSLIQQCLNQLTQSKVIRPVKDGLLITDPNMLSQILPELQEKLAA